MIILHPTRPHWVRDQGDEPGDLCAHSPVEFRVGSVELVGQEEGDWTVSAAALYLLRTLKVNHTPGQPVGDQLFPCCGHSMFQTSSSDDVMLIGCPNGVDVWIETHGDVVTLTRDGRRVSVGVEEWARAVCDFSDSVLALYASSAPKEPGDRSEDVEGYQAFRGEWERRLAAARSGALA